MDTFVGTSWGDQIPLDHTDRDMRRPPLEVKFVGIYTDGHCAAGSICMRLSTVRSSAHGHSARIRIPVSACCHAARCASSGIQRR
jgi:hypothetical protein